MKAQEWLRQVTVFTVGHSTHSLDNFVELLRAYGIERLVVVRAISNTHPRSTPMAVVANSYFKILWISICLLLTGGCFPAGKIPMDTIYFYRSKTSPNHTLLVFLPGRGDTVQSFEKNGFVDAARTAGIDSDMLGVEAHEEYYRDNTVFVRLKEDVIIPAKKQGYKDIWMVGISMGGLGAILYDTEYPGDLRGVFALAPFLGNNTIVDEISQAGGLARWQPHAVADGNREDSIIWSRLKNYVTPEKNAGRIYLGYGNDDRFVTTNRYFGNILPPEQVVSVPGGHDWPTWRLLWDMLTTRARRDAGLGGK
jgi:pimeloyl-ACP methyl ester carboxylesterase